MAKRLYSIFEKRGWRYHRISQFAYTKPVAVHVFQNMLLSGGKSLRPVQDSTVDGVRVHKPAVEQFVAKEPVRPALNDPAFIQSQLERKPVLVRAQSKTYRTGEGR